MEKNEKKRGYKVAVCDDEQIYTDSLVAELKKSEYEFDISAFSSGEQLLEAKEAFQIIFLDVMMGGMTGFQTAEQLRERGYQGLIIFLTSHTDNFTEAFRVKSFRYLLKPLQPDKLREALFAAEKELEEEKEVLVLHKGETVFLKCSDIACVKGLKDESVVYDVFGGEHLSNKAIGYWKEELPKAMFYQVHKSYLIALRYVVGLPKDGYISLKGKAEAVPVSKRTVTAFKEAYFQYARTRGIKMM